MALVVTSGEGNKHNAYLFAKNYGLKFVSIKDSQNYAQIYQLGIYSREEFENIIFRKNGRVILHWCGNDSLLVKDRIKRGKWTEKFPENITHLAQSPAIFNELIELGIKSEIKLRFNEKRQSYPLTALPEEFTGIIFDRENRERFCFKEIEEVISQCQDINFVMVGYGREEHSIKTHNIQGLKYVSLIEHPEEYRGILKKTSCLLRFNQDVEGFSQVMMQMLLLGRRVLSNIQQEHVENFDIKNTEGIIGRLHQLKNIKEPNIVASEFYHSRQDINNFDFLTEVNM